MRAYLAAGWFSESQEQARLEVIRAANEAGVYLYSPKDDFMYIKGHTKAKEVFTSNVYEINKCNFMIASTEGKDMGTVFECGYAFACGIPIVYYYKGEGNFNLMLSESGNCVCTNYDDLVIMLKSIVRLKTVPRIPYSGDVE